jgi:hypothetical protein
MPTGVDHAHRKNTRAHSFPNQGAFRQSISHLKESEQGAKTLGVEVMTRPDAGILTVEGWVVEVI